jgi:hypothetical protein
MNSEAKWAVVAVTTGIIVIIMNTAVEFRFQIKKNVANLKKKVNNPLKTDTMHSKSKFIVGLAVAAITFGSLWFGLGSEHFNRGHKLCDSEHGCTMEHHRHCCKEANEVHADKVIIIKEVVKIDSVHK